MLKNEILDIRRKEFSGLEKFLKVNLSELNIICAQIYGSLTYENVFIEGVSDIDVCIYSDVMNTMDPKIIIEIIMENNCDFKDKEPVIIDDYIARRIEFYIEINGTKFDITLLAPEVPRLNNIKKMSSYDSIDMIIGALYQHGITLFGSLPGKEEIQKNYIPFYNNEIRDSRLIILSNRIKNYVTRAKILIENKDVDIFDHIYKIRNHFLKWIFIYERKYPVNIQKHSFYQLKTILNLDDEEINIILFVNDKNIYNNSIDFIELLEKYLNKYEGEKYEKE